MRKFLLVLLVSNLWALTAMAAAAHSKTVIIYDGIATEVVPHPPLGGGLWVLTGDLFRATRFVIKPQGVCRDESCFPLPKSRKAEFLTKSAGFQWFNLSAFASLIHQPFAVDPANNVWFFGDRLSEQNQFVDSLEAPNFTLPDLNGKLHSLSDFRGKKVVLVTWASW